MSNDFKTFDEKEQKLDYYFKKIENFFKIKEDIILKYKQIPLDKILENAPKYYLLIQLIEKINVFLSKDKNWLIHFVELNKIKFDIEAFTHWKSSKEFAKTNYSDTQAPSKWIHFIQDYLLDMLESLQILMIIEFYLDEDDYKKFLRKNHNLFFKLKANFIPPSPPTEDIEKIFEIINYLLDINMKYDLTANLMVNAAICIQVYRTIDNSKLFELLKKKAFYLKFRLEYLKNTSTLDRKKLPFEIDLIKVAETFLKKTPELITNYNEYKKRLIEKKERIHRKVKY
jgi:hypothetical protein